MKAYEQQSQTVLFGDSLFDEVGKELFLDFDYSLEEKYYIERIRCVSQQSKKRFLRYMELFMLLNNSDSKLKNKKPERKISIIQDAEDHNIVVIHDIKFKGKRSVEWKDVEEYLRQYVGGYYTVEETNDIISIGTDLPSEYSGSVYTKRLKGTVAKAKANATQGIPEMIAYATAKTHEPNRKNKHFRDAKNGWYRYETRFALPVYDENGDIERYNIFHARLLIRHASSGKMYLYDVTEIKKETSKSCQA